MSKKMILIAVLLAGTTVAYSQTTQGQVGIRMQPLLQVFPNPTSAELTILSSEPVYKVVIVNILGQKVFEHNYSSTHVKIDIGHLPPGMYYVKADEMPLQKISKN